MPDEVFSGNRLQVAREFRGLTQRDLAEQVAASPALISLFEAGKKKNPSRDLVEAWADVLGFETGFFFLSIDDVFRSQECSFRHRRAAPEKLKTQIRAHATLMGMVVGRLRQLFKFPDLNIPTFPASTNEQILEAAESTRRHWGLNLDAPINQIARVLEHAGVIIIPHVVQTTKVDAFSRSGPLSMIFLNQAISSTSRWIFDIAHECGHLVMHKGIPTGSLETEAAADKFASGLLLPINAFSREFRSRTFSWEHIFSLKRRWRVSAAAIVRRAYDLGILDAVGYRQAYKYMSWKSWTSQGEPFEPEFEPPSLLADALDGLGNDVDLSVFELCKDLKLPPMTFTDITGRHVPNPNAPTVIAMIGGGKRR